MNRELMEALHKQAHDMADQMREDPVGLVDGHELVVTGFVFRPATPEEVEEHEQEDPIGGALWVYQAHFLVQDHPFISHTATQVYMDLPAQSYTDASDFLLTLLQQG